MNNNDKAKSLPSNQEHNQLAVGQADVLYPTNAYPNYASPPEQTDDEIDLRELWAVLSRNKALIITLTLFIFLITLVVTLLMKPIYRAGTTLQINPENSEKVVSYDVNTQEQAFTGKDFYQTQYELLKSKALARLVIDELNLDHRLEGDKLAKPFFSEFLDNIKDELKQAIGSISIGDEESQINKSKIGKVPAETLFLKSLTVSPVKNSRIVNIYYDHEDPELAADIVNTLADKFIKMNLDRRVDAASYAETFLKEQLVQAKSRLQESEADLVKYAKERGIINIEDAKGGNYSLTSQSLSALNKALAEAESERIDAESKYKHTTQSSKATRVQENPVVQQLKESKAKLQAEYQEKLGIYKPAYPLMVQIRGRIKELDSEIRKEINSSQRAASSILKGAYIAAKQKEDNIRKKLKAQKSNYMKFKDNSIQYNTLKREVETNRQLYNDLLQRMKEVGVAGSVGTNNLSVVDRAEVPYKIHKPNIKLNLALGMVLGLFVGIGFAFLREFLNDTVKSSEEIERLTHTSVLGLLPYVKGRKDDPALLDINNPNSSTSEAIRTLRTHLLFSTQEGMPKSLLITSATPSEGKSSLSINLATMLCQSGKTTLLIDCDLRVPALHKKLKLDNSEGLSNYLTNQIDEEAATKATDIDGLFVITAGPNTPNPVELLSGDRMQELMTLATEKFDTVIIDAPPVMGLADALVLSNYVNATLFVIAYGQAKRKAVQDAYNRLKNAQANIIGTVFTKVKQTSGYGDYYYDYYGYGTDKTLGYSEKKGT